MRTYHYNKGIPVNQRIAEHPRPGHFILHFSDTHLISGDSSLYGDVDADFYLKQIFAEVVESGARPEAIIFTGDIADTGEPEAYAKARTMAQAFADATGAELIWVMGNHDDRANFRMGLLGEAGSTEPIDNVYQFGGLRIISLDTSVPGHHYGELEQSQLNWLSSVLETKSEEGTILALHHPPVPSVLDMAATVELRDQKSLAEIISNSDIRTIIGGHLHYSSFTTFAGIPVSVASSTCYTQDLNVKQGGTFGRDTAQGFNMIHVYKDNIMHSVVPAGKGKLVGRFISPEESTAILKREGIIIPT
jgi:3',5'-cyclic AMP phosphodiesterase CpdA